MVVSILKTELDIRDDVTKLFEKGDIEKGDALLAEKADILSDHIKLECLGNRFFYKTQFQDAVRCYEEGIALAPNHQVSRYQYLVGTQLEKQGNFVDAFKRYQAAIEIDPKFIDSYIELGGLLIKVEDYEGALKCYRDAYELDSKDVRNLFNLKNVLEKLVENGNVEYQGELERFEELSEGIQPPNDDARW